MIFADLLFLYVFLPLNLIFYFIFKNNNYRNIVLVTFSLLFYAWGEPVMILLLLSTTVMNFFFALYIEKAKTTNKAKAKAISVTAVTFTLILLAVFKYGGFITGNISILFGLNLPQTSISLPVGISFYSFQIISYIVDVYKGEIKAQRSCLKFLMYISLYPQLIAGPIVRYKSIANEINDRKSSSKDISSGITRFTIGLAKKVIIANQTGEIAGSILSAELSGLSVTGAWIGILMFALQIYYDFSGYSDMAIGLGRMFGFHFPENFNHPYIAKSITEFWRRWHITLSGFFRDYVYIPLGGNRKHIYLNLFAVWSLTGLWHGASWNFVLWGLYFGVLISLEKAFLLKLSEKLPAFIRHISTMFFVVLGWAVFYFIDFSQMMMFIKALFGMNGVGLYDMVTFTTAYNKIFIIITAILFCTPVYECVKKVFDNNIKAVKIDYTLKITVNALFIIICTVLLVGNTYNPFLYYKF